METRKYEKFLRQNIFHKYINLMQKDPGHFQVLIFRREENVFLNSGTKKILTDRIHNILLSSNWCRIPYRDTLRILPIFLSRNPRKRFGVQEPILDRSRVPLRVSVSEMCGDPCDGNCWCKILNTDRWLIPLFFSICLLVACVFSAAKAKIAVVLFSLTIGRRLSRVSKYSWKSFIFAFRCRYSH